MRELQELETAFRDYKKPRLDQFLDPGAFKRSDTYPVEWAEDFLNRELRPNDANEFEAVIFSMSALGLAYLLPLWIRETLNGKWDACCNIYSCNNHITDPQTWGGLSSTIDQVYNSRQKRALGQAMIMAAHTPHFDDVSSKLHTMGLSLA